MKGNGAGRRGRSKGKKERKRKGEKQTANDNPRTLGSGVMRTAACPTKGCYFLASETIVIIVIMLMGRQICQIHWIHIAYSHNLGSLHVPVTLCSIINFSDCSSIRPQPTVHISCQTPKYFRCSLFQFALPLIILQCFSLV